MATCSLHKLRQSIGAGLSAQRYGRTLRPYKLRRQDGTMWRAHADLGMRGHVSCRPADSSFEPSFVQEVALSLGEMCRVLRQFAQTESNLDKLGSAEAFGLDVLREIDAALDDKLGRRLLLPSIAERELAVFDSLHAVGASKTDLDDAAKQRALALATLLEAKGLEDPEIIRLIVAMGTGHLFRDGEQQAFFDELHGLDKHSKQRMQDEFRDRLSVVRCSKNSSVRQRLINAIEEQLQTLGSLLSANSAA